MHNQSLINMIRHLTVGLSAGLMAYGLISSCGRETIEKQTGAENGAVPGAFMVRIAPQFREKIDSIQKSVEKIIPSSEFTVRFAGDDSSFGLTGNYKLSDIYKISLPDTGSETANESYFSQLKDLADSSGNYFANIDTEKYISGELYQTTDINDPEYQHQYYLEMINWQSAVESLSDDQLNSGTPIVVGVLDTGVQYDHEDLNDVMWREPETNKIIGYDAIAGKVVSTPSDEHGHGTHVAGIIGGVGKNSKGIHGAGFLKKPIDQSSLTEIMSVRVLNEDGAGTSESISNGLRWAVQKHLAQKEMVGRESQHLIINMSLGGPFETDAYEYSIDENGDPIFANDVFDYAAFNNVLMIVAAGNDSCGIGGSCKVLGKRFQKTYYFPCSYRHVLCVAASTHEDQLAGFSNRASSIGISAPGWQIYSSVPYATSKAQYAYVNGTSQAAPVTAGSAAILWSMYPDFSASQIKAILTRSAAQVEEISGELKSGGGRLDLKKAFEFAQSAHIAGIDPIDEGEIVPETDAKDLDTPINEGDPLEESARIEGDAETNENCGTLGQLAPSHAAYLLIALLLPLIDFIRRDT